ncbi:hypothetical protein ACJZ2D_010330 [Fusarium nematophilum]
MLNLSGVRFGSAEIYSVIERMPEIQGSLCVGQRRSGNDDESVVLFVQMVNGHPFTLHDLQALTRDRLIPQPAPYSQYIFDIPEIPYTANGKKVEKLVKQIIGGKDAVVGPSIVNPSYLGFYK